MLKYLFLNQLTYILLFILLYVNSILKYTSLQYGIVWYYTRDCRKEVQINKQFHYWII